MTSIDFQAQNDSKNDPKKGMMDHNILNTLMAQNKILRQQLEALIAQMTKLPQQIQAEQVSQSQSQEIRCELCLLK